MIVLALNLNKDDNPDTNYPYLVDTSKLSESFAKLIEESHPDKYGSIDVDMTYDEFDQYEQELSKAKVVIPFTGTIDKDVTIWWG